MGLLSFLQRKTPDGSAPAKGRKREAAATASASDLVQQARVRARRRLIGATVLVGAGIIGFPLLFETQPRPVPVNIPIELPARDGQPALQAPPARVSSGAVVLPGGAIVADAAADARGHNAAGIVTERADEQGREVAPKTPKVAEKSAEKPAEKPAEKVVDKAVDKPVEKPKAVDKPADKPADKHVEKPAPKVADKAPEKAASKPADKHADKPADKTADAKKGAEAGRFVVQAGSYTDAGQVRDGRAKVEKLGFKTYTQQAVIDGTQRTRVRVGPFATREEADKVAAKLKAAGVAAAILSL